MAKNTTNTPTEEEIEQAIAKDKGIQKALRTVHRARNYKVCSKPKYTTNQMKLLVDSYLRKCEIEGKVPHYPGFAIFIGMDTKSVNYFANKDKDPELQASIHKLKTVYEGNVLDRMFSSKIHPSNAIFLLKASHGYQDRQEVDITSGGKQMGGAFIVGLPQRGRKDGKKEDKSTGTKGSPSS